jgi:hypothetical protein
MLCLHALCRTLRVLVWAASEGLIAATAAAVMLPHKLLQLGAQPSSWSVTRWMTAWQDAAELWAGVGNAALHAALRPSKTTVVSNEARLAPKAG